MKPKRLNRQVLASEMEQEGSDPAADLCEIFEFAPIGIYQCTIDRFIAGNLTLARMFGYPSAHGMAASVGVPGELFVDMDQERAATSAAMAAKGAIQRQVEFLRSDGTTFAGNLSIKAVRNADGKIRLFDVFVEDLTARKRAEMERLKMLLAFERDRRGGILPVTSWRDTGDFEFWWDTDFNERESPSRHEGTDG